MSGSLEGSPSNKSSHAVWVGCGILHWLRKRKGKGRGWGRIVILGVHHIALTEATRMVVEAD